ncbi:MAG TPA: LLM class F420-dependent oxidoreductase [Acidimicrobiales bacterium]
MQIGIFFPSKEHGPVDEMVARTAGVADQGLHSVWLPQSSSFDALTVLAAVGREVPRVELGTSVVPTFPRHPAMLAAQALTTNAATGGRLALGIGLSHRFTIEDSYGLSYDRPARHMREYLSVLLPAIRTGAADFTGETLAAHVTVAVPGAVPCPVYLAALQPAMLRLAGGLADGTITWCTGPVTLERQIVPIITETARDAGRPAPRIVVALPCCVTDDEADGRKKADKQLDGYGRIPVYRAVLDAEGVSTPGDISVVGDERSVTDQLSRLAEIGASDFVAIPCGDRDDRARTMTHLASTAST